MADYTDTKVSQLVINNLTQEKFEELKAKGELQDDQIYCTPDLGNGHSLFDVKWADHILNDVQWLRADNFSWHSGDVYKSAYEHLANEFDITKPIEVESFGGVSVYFRTSPDGHKIVLADGEQDVVNMYDATGVAWYYILDLDNKRFKLPRTKFGFTGLRDSVGAYIPAGLPNITATFAQYTPNVGDLPVATATGAAYGTRQASVKTYSATIIDAGSGNTQIGIDASRSSSVYGASNTVQPRATQMYLYFYVGNYTKTKLELDAGQLSEQINAKADVNLANIDNDARSIIADMGVPSETYVDLTLGANGAAYTAPADGYVYVSKASSDGDHLQINQGSMAVNSFSPKSGASLKLWFPVRAGGFTVSYSSGGTSATFRFVYAEGTKHLA